MINDLEQIRLDEKRKRPFKGYFTYIFIQTTASQAQSEMYSVPAYTIDKDFQPSWLRKVFLGLAIGFTLFWIIGFVLQTKTEPTSKLIVIPLVALTIFFIYDGFINTKSCIEFI